MHVYWLALFIKLIFGAFFKGIVEDGQRMTQKQKELLKKKVVDQIETSKIK
jgi:hypothetical protein